MNPKHIEEYSHIEQPFQGEPPLVADLKRPLEWSLSVGQGCPAQEMTNRLADGVALLLEYEDESGHLDTAYDSLRRLLAAKGIAVHSQCFPIRIRRDGSLMREEHTLAVRPEGIEITAADADGVRRAVYLLEERIAAAEGKSCLPGFWRRRPFIRNRISRCFFGPTNRAPFFIDELANDIDYYPDDYLDKLAHEGINALWLTMYFRDLPSDILPGKDNLGARRLEKLRLTVRRCLRYGIRIFLFFSEPKYFNDSGEWWAVPTEAASAHPELLGSAAQNVRHFCTSTEAGREYIRETLHTIFHAVPGLGGAINIMLGEDNGSCVAAHVQNAVTQACPRCSTRPPAEIYRELACLMRDAIRSANPQADFIGWFYTPGQRDGGAFSQRLLEAVSQWPDDCGLMFNFESGGFARQLGKERPVFDYSLSFVGPSGLFAEVARSHGCPAAKLQVGCSHEDASVPFIPVPSNLFLKYRALHELGAKSVMQCWYFGNYPGLMNRAAGILSFEPFPESEEDFLLELARPHWGRHSAQAAEAWRHFAEGYRQFPACLAFEWYGPLHHCIAWPLHLFPVDAPISPSWLLKSFPEVSGDRIGECLNYQFTLDECRRLCHAMDDEWQRGLRLFRPLREPFANDRPRLDDIRLAEAIGLQIRSACNLLDFYALREEMLYLQQDNLEAMRSIVEEEILNSEKMLRLCQEDPRLGYHSEAEGYLFFPQKLRARIDLLHELLAEDFPQFRLDDPRWREYTGAVMTGPSMCAVHGENPADWQPLGSSEHTWGVCHDGEFLTFILRGCAGKTCGLEVAPCRLWPPVRLDVNWNGRRLYYVGTMFRTLPDFSVDEIGNDLRIRLPLAIFDGFRRPGFPLRVNVWCEDDSWIPRNPLPPRLMHRDHNPMAAGWLIDAPHKVRLSARGRISAEQGIPEAWPPAKPFRA
ncbi:MAG: hypothetical protein IJJ33_02140 [Victivallales bacterium]|nr:hypothetical protein [Victivallales bacterium]